MNKNCAVVLLAEGFEEVEAITPIDFLRRAGIQVQILGIGAGPDRIIVGSHGIQVRTEFAIEAYRDIPQCVVLPGGLPGAENLRQSEAAAALVKRVLEADGIIAAICAAPGVALGTWGYLNEETFTCYPGFQEKVPKGNFLDERVVVSGNFITSQGAGTAAEFAIQIIRSMVGNEVADKVKSSTLQGF